MGAKKKKNDTPDSTEANLPGAQFKINEIVLAYHGPMLYEAKVLKHQASSKGGQFAYFVHYNKWSKRWDEWVTAERLMTKNEENKKKVQKAKEDLKKLKLESKKRSADPVTKAAKVTKKRKADPTVEPEEERAARKEIKLKIPGQIKKYLVQDWTNVTRNKMLVPLPRNPSVSQILDSWATHKARSPDQLKVVNEVVEGLKRFFSRALGMLLLYRFERPQFNEIVDRLAKEKKSDDEFALCDIYGAEHLARLFVKLPTILTHTKILDSEILLLQTKFTDFLKWFSRAKFFCVDKYEPTDSEYAIKVAEVPK